MNYCDAWCQIREPTASSETPREDKPSDEGKKKRKWKEDVQRENQQHTGGEEETDDGGGQKPHSFVPVIDSGLINRHAQAILSRLG